MIHDARERLRVWWPWRVKSEANSESNSVVILSKYAVITVKIIISWERYGNTKIILSSLSGTARCSDSPLVRRTISPKVDNQWALRPMGYLIYKPLMEDSLFRQPIVQCWHYLGRVELSSVGAMGPGLMCCRGKWATKKKLSEQRGVRLMTLTFLRILSFIGQNMCSRNNGLSEYWLCPHLSTPEKTWQHLFAWCI